MTAPRGVAHSFCTPQDAAEVASAFTQLKSEGKVRFFGVSNHTPAQLELLQSYLSFPLVTNQVATGGDNSMFLADGPEGRDFGGSHVHTAGRHAGPSTAPQVSLFLRFCL